MSNYIIILTTFPDAKTAKIVCETLIKEKLAACCQIIKGIESIYWWKNKIESSKEYLCFFKTTKPKFKSVRKRIISLHPYQVPEIVSIDIGQIENKYAKWIDETLF